MSTDSGDLGVGVRESVVAELAGRGAETQSGARLDGAQVRGLWRRLLEGRCRLVGSFERDGRRYYVMRDVHAGLPPLASLDAREQRLAELIGSGESEKAVAYALGVTPSAISATLKTTLAKLGLGSRGDLVFLVRSMRLAAAA